METKVFGIGQLGARVTYTVTAQTGGRILEIRTDKGRWVRKGDPLVIVDPVDLPQLLEEARLSVTKARLDLNASESDLQSLLPQEALARRNFERYAMLREKDSASQMQYDNVRTDLKVIEAKIAATRARIEGARTGIALAEKNLQAVRERLSRHRVLSPVSGYVTGREAAAGQSVLPSQPILQIVVPRDLRAETFIDERLSASVAVGQKARITLRSHPGKEYTGLVSRLDPRADPVTLEKTVEISFDRVPSPITLNEQTEVEIVTGRLEKVLKIPATALVYHETTPGVWTVEKGRARFVPLKILAMDGKEVAVEGIDARSVILLASPAKKPLEEGMRVYTW